MSELTYYPVRYRKCPVCGALIGEPCATLTGAAVNGQVLDAQLVPRTRPHSRRRLRSGAS